MEVLSVVMGLEMGKFVHNHIFHEFSWRVGEFRVVCDVPFPEGARPPHRFHRARLPCDIRFAQAQGPLSVQFSENGM